MNNTLADGQVLGPAFLPMGQFPPFRGPPPFMRPPSQLGPMRPTRGGFRPRMGPSSPLGPPRMRNRYNTPSPQMTGYNMGPRPQHFASCGTRPSFAPRKQFNGNNYKNENKPKKFKPNANTNEGEHYCEVCDRSWKSEELLKEHISQHVTCHIGDCKYSAAPKMVQLHIKLQHDSGMFDKIVKSYNEEEIKKWKEERRRNFPTLKNIEEKLAKKKEMDDRGERLTDSNEPFKKNEKGFSYKKGKHNRMRKKKNKRPVGQENQQFHSSTVSPGEDLREVVDVAGEELNQKISDDEWVGEEKLNKEEKSNNSVSNVLTLLSSSYASDSEEPETVQNDKSDDSDEAPTEEKVSRTSDDSPNIHIEKCDNIKDKPKPEKRPKLIKPIVGEWKAPPTKKRRLTLLEKLLDKEIRQERNQILQCIRHIIKENYFDN